MYELKSMVNGICIAVALLAGGTLHAWGTRCDVNGGAGQIELKPEGADVRNIFWGPESKRKFFLFYQKKNLKEGKNSISFSFIPKKSGFVTITLDGCWAKRGGFKDQDKEITRVSDIKLEGAVLKNADFKEKNSQGKPRHWTFGPDCTVENGGVLVWNLSGASQRVKVTADQKVTISYMVEFIEFEPAEK